MASTPQVSEHTSSACNSICKVEAVFRPHYRKLKDLCESPCRRRCLCRRRPPPHHLTRARMAARHHAYKHPCFIRCQGCNVFGVQTTPASTWMVVTLNFPPQNSLQYQAYAPPLDFFFVSNSCFNCASFQTCFLLKESQLFSSEVHVVGFLSLFWEVDTVDIDTGSHISPESWVQTFSIMWSPFTWSHFLCCVQIRQATRDPVYSI